MFLHSVPPLESSFLSKTFFISLYAHILEFNIFTSAILSNIYHAVLFKGAWEKKKRTEKQTLEFYVEKKSLLGKTVRFPNHIEKNKQTNKNKPTIASKSLRCQTFTLVKIL